MAHGSSRLVALGGFLDIHGTLLTHSSEDDDVCIQ